MYAVMQEHPSGSVLKAYSLGQLGEEDLAGIDCHLADCGVCRQVVEGVVPDTLLSLLRSAATEPDSTENVAGVEVLRNPGEGSAGSGGPRRAQGPRAANDQPPAALANHPRYRVGELLGVGGMGVVYKAEHLLMERPVALKVLNRELIDKPATIERFRREVRAAARLTHPNIVAGFDAEQAGDVHFLVMEYVEGVSLARLIAEKGPLPVEQACDFVRQAALGLEHAHERGMVHRDIKPQNLMLTPGGQVKILDFGLARFVMESVPAGAMLGKEDAFQNGAQNGDSPLGIQGDSPRFEPRFESAAKPLTQIGIVMGTPDYIAPEQARDSHVADIRADIYSLGCTLYDLLAGHAPFPGGSAVQKVKAHLERTPRPLRDLRRDVPPELAKIIERMMAKDPAQRYQTPVEVAAALTPYLAPPKPPRRKRWPALVAGFACAAAMIAGIVIYVQTDNGTIVIETNDEKIAVMIEKAGGVKIVDQANQREYHLQVGEKDIPSGNYQIKVSEPLAGLEFQVNQFELTRGKEVRLTAKLAGKGKGNATERVLTASERDAARKRLENLQEILSINEAMFRNGQGTLLQVLKAKRDIAKVELTLCETDRERIKVYKRLVSMAQELVNVRSAQHEAGAAMLVDVLNAKAEYQEAKSDLDYALARQAVDEKGPVMTAGKKSDASKNESDVNKWLTSPPTMIAKGEGPLYAGKPASFWLNQMQDANPKFRAEAVVALGSIALTDRRFLPPLLASLKDNDASVGKEGAKALALFDPPIAVPGLLDMLKDRSSKEGMRHAAEALERMATRLGPEEARVVLQLSLALKVKDTVLRRTVSATLGRIGSAAKPAMPALVEVLGDYLSEVHLKELNATSGLSIGPDLSIKSGKSLPFYAFDGKNSPPAFLMNAMLLIEPLLQEVFLPLKAKNAATNDAEDYRWKKAQWQTIYDALKAKYPPQTSASASASDLKQELAKFEGTWLVIKDQVKSETSVPKSKSYYVFSAKNLVKSIQITGEDKITNDVVTFDIDPGQSPKAIDFFTIERMGEGFRTFGIYELKDNSLTICIPSSRDKKRPTSFVDNDKSLNIVFLTKVQDVNPGVDSAKPESKDQGPPYAGKAASFWLNQLKDTNAKFRAEAVEALGNIAEKNKDLIPALVAALKDKDYNVGHKASEALWNLGPEAVPGLLEVLKDKSSPMAVNLAAEALGMIGQDAKAAVPLLIQTLKMEKGVGWRSATIALGLIGLDAKPAIPTLIDALGDFLKSKDALAEVVIISNSPKGFTTDFDDFSFPKILAHALKQIDPEIQDIPTRSKRAKGEEPKDAKKTVLEAKQATLLQWQKAYDELKKKHPPQTSATSPDGDLKQELSKLEGTWLETKQQVKWETIVPPGKIYYVFSGNTITIMEGEKKIFNVMKFKIDPSKTPKTIDTVSPALGDQAGFGIYELKGDTLKICLGLPDINADAKNRPPTFEDTEKKLVIVFLKKAKEVEPDAVSPKSASKDEVPLFAGKPASFWLNQIKDANAKYRGEAVEALGNIAKKNTELIPVLVASFKDNDTYDGRYSNSSAADEAARALGALGPVAVPALVKVLEDEGSPTVAIHVAHALSTIGPEAKAAVPALIKQLRKENIDVRHAAIFALRQIGPEAKPAVPVMIDILGEYLKSKIVPKLAAPRGISARSVHWGAVSFMADLSRALSYVDPGLKDIVPMPGPGKTPAGFGNTPPEQQLVDRWQKAYEELRKRYPAQTSAPSPDIQPKESADDGKNVQEALYRGKPASYWMTQSKDADPKFRAEAVNALAFFGKTNKDVVALLVAYLKDEDPSVSLKAAKALGSMGPEVLPPLLELLKDKSSPKPLEAAALALFHMDGAGSKAKAAVPLLSDALKIEDWQVRKTIIRALGTIGPEAKPALPAMMECLQDYKTSKLAEPDISFVFIFGRALSKIDPEIKELVPNVSLDPLLENNLQQIYDALKKKYPTQAAASADGQQALLYRGKPARYWMGQFKDSDPKFRAEAVTALGSMAQKNKNLIPVLVEALADKEYALGSQAVAALGSLGPEIVPVILDVLKKPQSPTAFTNAAKVVGKIGAPAKDAVPFLERGLKADATDGPDQRAIILALGRIGPDAKPAIPALVDMLGHYLESVKDIPKQGKIGPGSTGTGSLASPNSLPRKLIETLQQIDPGVKDVLPERINNSTAFLGGAQNWTQLKEMWDKTYGALKKRYPK